MKPFLFTIVLLFPMFVLAQTGVGSGRGTGATDVARERLGVVSQRSGYDVPGYNVPGAGKQGILRIVQVIMQAALGFLGVLFTLMVVYAGWQWGTAGGNEEQIRGSKRRIFFGIVGLMIVAGAFLITAFVLQSIQKATVQYEYEGDDDSLLFR